MAEEQKKPADEVNPNADEAAILANKEEVKAMVEGILLSVQTLLKKIG